MTYSQVCWPILGISALQLTHPKCTHTVNTHLEQWAAIHAAAPGEQLGVWCLAQGHLSRGIEGGRERCTFTPPTYNSCRTWDSNSQPLDYESDSLTIRPRLPPNWAYNELSKFSNKIFDKFESGFRSKHCTETDHFKVANDLLMLVD